MSAGLSFRFVARFVRDFKRIGRHPQYERETLLLALDDFTQHDPLPAMYREHALEGAWTGYCSADLGPDLRVIFRRHPTRREVVLHRIGSHADLYAD